MVMSGRFYTWQLSARLDTSEPQALYDNLSVTEITKFGSPHVPYTSTPSSSL